MHRPAVNLFALSNESQVNFGAQHLKIWKMLTESWWTERSPLKDSKNTGRWSRCDWVTNWTKTLYFMLSSELHCSLVLLLSLRKTTWILSYLNTLVKGWLFQVSDIITKHNHRGRSLCIQVLIYLMGTLPLSTLFGILGKKKWKLF